MPWLKSVKADQGSGWKRNGGEKEVSRKEGEASWIQCELQAGRKWVSLAVGSLAPGSVPGVD